ncbi:hypothetical protein [uncultured Desulfobacter sp.]|uniref:hypothetical protein n=1 Tax=uncultured Desulfobacter sp. TaxID=240139 RepID=UPI002AA8BDE8|nr:hypothetical protein [uncultured Desulfobacter sp.]
MDKITLKTLDQLIQLETMAVQTYDLALKSVTDPVIRARLEKFKVTHTGNAEQLSKDILKILHNHIAANWDDITSAKITTPAKSPGVVCSREADFK